MTSPATANAAQAAVHPAVDVTAAKSAGGNRMAARVLVPVTAAVQAAIHATLVVA